MSKRIVLHFLETFSNLHVLREVSQADGRRRFECICDCQNLTTVHLNNLRSKKQRSCGCLRNRLLSERRFKHGLTGSPEMDAISQAIERCHSPQNPGYKNYGGRGIKVCDEWRKDRLAFFLHIGPRPARGYSLERKSNNIGYFPGNVRWATRKEQNRNKRSNVWVSYNGERRLMVDVAEEVGIPYKTVLGRRHEGKSDQELFVPLRRKRS